MARKILSLLLTFVLGAVAGRFAFPAAHLPFSAPASVMAQTNAPFKIIRLYTGPDNQTHEEEIEPQFAGNVFKMLPVKGAELRRSAAGSVMDWHPGAARQYVITLSGQGEVEIAGGKKIPAPPGQIELIEDVTGKGHISRVTGTDDRIMLWLPLADQANSK